MILLAPSDRAILDSLLLRYQTTAQELARRLSLPPSTIASSLARLQAKGCIVRAGEAGPSIAPPGLRGRFRGRGRGRGRGRPTVAYLPRLPGPVAAVLLDGSQIGGAILDDAG